MFIHSIFRWHLACLDKKVDIGKFLMVFNTHRTGITVDWTPKKLTEIGKKLVIDRYIDIIQGVAKRLLNFVSLSVTHF